MEQTAIAQGPPAPRSLPGPTWSTGLTDAPWAPSPAPSTPGQEIRGWSSLGQPHGPWGDLGFCVLPVCVLISSILFPNSALGLWFISGFTRAIDHV
jgi:hypothetical protein